MTTSEQINELASALAKAQGEMKNPTLDGVNPHFKSKFATLANVRNTVVPVLAKHGLALVQALSSDDAGIRCETRLLHVSGQWMAETLSLPVSKADAQGFASAATYAKRISLQAWCVVVGDEDDDGTAASAAPAQKLVEPDGFASWRLDLEAVVENGSEALKAAWLVSRVEYRRHLVATAPASWDAMKKRAEAVKCVGDKVAQP